MDGFGGFTFTDFDGMFAPPADFSHRRWQFECLSALKSLVRYRMSEGDESPLFFLVSAGVGAGKTNAAALMASYVLASGLARRVVYVAPNRAIVRYTRKAFARFNIDLLEWNNKRHSEGEPSIYQGAVLTYAALASRPHLQARLCRRKTLVIFDEVHHLGDALAWGQGALEAFRGAKVLIGLSGTPYRSDNREIPFVKYEPIPMKDNIRVFNPDYVYPLGRAVADGVCREPLFRWLDGEVELTKPSGEQFVCTFKSDISPESANARLSGAVAHGSFSRLDALKTALEECRAEGRKLIIFVGGDSFADTTAIEDASIHLPAELEAMGVPRDEVVSITSNDPEAVDKAEAFGKSKAWVLVTVNMVSEGMDIPELSAVLFLTSITAKATTIQRIGRALRKRTKDDPIGVTLVFMFHDPRYEELAAEIKESIDHEINVLQRRSPERVDGPQAEPRPKTLALGLNARVDGATFNGRSYSEEECTHAVDFLKGKKIAPTAGFLGMALMVLFPQSGEAEGGAA